VAACLVLVAALFLRLAAAHGAYAQTDQLPSWNDHEAKQRIIKFVQNVTDHSNPEFVAPEKRIATFDLDGTLWTEQPEYAEIAFLKHLLELHPDLTTGYSFTSFLGTIRQLVGFAKGMPRDDFVKEVDKWLKTQKHPCFDRPYTDLAYKPMLELLDYLRAKGFKTYIISGSGIEFLRTFSEQVFRIPPEQVVGTTVNTDYKKGEDGEPVLVLKAWPEFIDNQDRKAESINEFIGRRPIAAFGNSDGDKQML
jgi:phosphoserine phosphatase